PRPGAAVDVLWKDRTGNVVASLADIFALSSFRVSPDGRRIAVSGQPTQDSEWGLWLYEMEGPRPRRLGQDEPGIVAWSPDGRRIAHRLTIDGRVRAVVSSVGRSQEDEM